MDPDELLQDSYIANEVITGNSNTGDASSIYTSPFGSKKLVQGSITSNQNSFKISGATSMADVNCLNAFAAALQEPAQQPLFWGRAGH